MKLELSSKNKMSVACAALLAALSFSTPLAIAQEGEDGDDPYDGDDVRKADVLVVTAQRRAESLQDVPVTVTAFGAQQVEEARIQQIGDIVTLTPGLSFDTFPASQPRLFIRGIGSSDRGAAGDPSSAVFLDEIYLGRPAAIAFDAFDVERIEVLKGPQGTLYGRNVVGGAINVITKRPDVEAFSASANLTYGNYNRVEGAGFVNVPLSDNNNSALRVSGAYRTHDGYTDNEYLNEDIEDQETLSGRLQYYVEPTERSSVLLTLDGTKDRATGPAHHVLELDSSDPLSNFYSQNFDPDVSYGSEVGSQDRDTYGLRAEISNDFDFGTLTFLASYRDLDYLVDFDFDGGNADPASPGFNGVNINGGNVEEAQLSSQELRLSSLPESATDWVVGLFAYQQDVQRLDIFTLDTAAVAPIPLTEIYDQDAELDSFAVFADVSRQLSDRVTVFGGLRYSRDEKSYSVRNTDGDAPLRGDEFFDVTSTKEFDDWTYRAGMEFQLDRNSMIYGTISRGFKSGGFQETPATAEDAAMPFEPEVATQYEIGQKSTFADGDLIWNNTLFYLDYTDLQTRQNIDGRIVTGNAGAATIKGYETQLVANWNDNFDLSLSYAYLDATFDEFMEGGVDYSGNRISRAPEHKVSVTPSYRIPLENGAEVKFAADYNYTSKIFDDNSNQPPELREETHFIDARMVVDGLPNGWGVSVWGKNLTDERARVWQAIFLGANFGAFNPPRTYGVTLSKDF